MDLYLIVRVLVCLFWLDAFIWFILTLIYSKGDRAIITLEDGRKIKIRDIRKAALEGDAKSQFTMGELYYSSSYFKQDHAEAAKWWRMAADQGYAQAYFNLASLYAKGDGVDEDENEASKLYHKAIESNVEDANIILAMCYYNGYGVTKNYEKAVEIFREELNKGSSNARYLLGWCYYGGNGVEKNYDKAFRLFRQAAEEGNTQAKYYLGECYLNGYGVDKDKGLAKKWFQKAAQQGDSDAIEKLRLLFANKNAVALSFCLGICFALVACFAYMYYTRISQIEFTDNWKNAKLYHNFDNYQLNDGKAYLDNGNLFIESKSGWSFYTEGNNYILFNVCPDDMTPHSEFCKDSNQGLYIGLLDDNNSLVSQKCLASRIKDISKVKVNSKGDFYLLGTLPDDSKTNVVISLPEPPTPLPDIYTDVEKYLEVYAKNIGKMAYSNVHPGHSMSAQDDSFYSSNINSLVNSEREKALEIYYYLFRNEEGLTNVNQKLDVINLLGGELNNLINKENEAEKFGVTISRRNLYSYVVEEAQKIIWDNLIRAIKYPENWRRVRNLKGVFRGIPFEAKDGIVIFRANVKQIDSDEISEEILILKLLWDGEMNEEWCYKPHDFSKYCENKIKFELIDPNNVTGTYMPETGYFIYRDGVWIEGSIDSTVTNAYKGIEILQ